MSAWDVAILNYALYLLLMLAILTWASNFMGWEWMRHMFLRAKEERDDDADHVKDHYKPPGSGPGSLA